MPEREAPRWRAAVGQVPRPGATCPALTMAPGKPAGPRERCGDIKEFAGRHQEPRALSCGEPEFLPERGFRLDLIDNREPFTFVKQVVLIN